MHFSQRTLSALITLVAPLLLALPAQAELPDERLVMSPVAARDSLAAADLTLGLYARRRVAGPVEFMAQPGPKRLQLVMLRNVSADHIGRALMQAFRQHATRLEMAAHTEHLLGLGAAFGSRRGFAAGDRISLELAPGAGTSLRINSDLVSTRIGDVDFFSLLLRAWAVSSPERV